jgi:acyl carrier protein
MAAFTVPALPPWTPKRSERLDTEIKEMTVSSNDHETALDAPMMTRTEEVIAQIWQGLFRVTQVGAGDDFFELGGNSLTAIKFLARLEERFGVDVLAPETLYDDARLGSLAKAIDEEMA